jgi:hypothetical protein
VQQLLDVADRKIGELAGERSRHRNANAQEMIALTVLTCASLEKALKKHGVLGVAGFLQPTPYGGHCHRCHVFVTH